MALLAGIVGLGASAPAATASTQTAVPTAHPARVVPAARASYPGVPPRDYVPAAGPRFAFPNRSKAERQAIRGMVLATVQGTWGGALDSNRLPLATNGRIRIATWSFKDMAEARALVAAKNRGVSVQVMAAEARNKDSRPWHYLRKHLGAATYKPGVVGSTDSVSFARTCRGACRGPGGTPHSKFFIFDNVGYAHHRDITIQSSMNLTNFGANSQWNFAQVLSDPAVYNSFLTIFREMRLNRPQAQPYRAYKTGTVNNIFFPFPQANAGTDPVMQMLNQVSCLGSTASSSGRTRIRIINYSIYDTRGTWIAKKLHSLYNAGCDIKIIYSLTTRPVLGILRSNSGRGPIPIRQSIILNSHHEIVKYNHSKWMTIAGKYAGNPDSWLVMSGSSNWSNIGFTSDEQMQQINHRGTTQAYMLNFDKTWAQKTSRAPTFAPVAEQRGLPSDQPAFGKGELKYMNAYGD